MFKTFLVAVILFFALSATQASASLIAPEKRCPNQRVSDKPTRGESIRSMLCMVNYARAKSGLRPLKQHPKLVWSALRKSQDINRCNQFSHTACGDDFSKWIKRSGYLRTCYAIGENIAWGGGSLGGVRSIFIAWMNSPGHRKAILSRDYVDTGINFVYSKSFQGSRGAMIWTEHFGRRC